jgi:peptidoglycan/xylan/chitin deacetylase (PgdA/CDA1 family)
MILMYHHVAPAAEVPAVADRCSLEGWDYNLAPEDFAFQLEELRRRKFRFVSLAEYVSRAVEADRGPGDMVAVTFDDGWLDNHTHALPVLARLGIPATFFVVSGPLQGVADVRRMTSMMLREMIAAGMTIGAHTRTHPNLATLSDERLDEEIGGCKADLEAVIGRPVEFLAYPGGRYNEAVLRCVERHGFRAACSVAPAGRNGRDVRYTLSRDVFAPQMDGWRDRLLLRSGGRWLWRMARRAKGLI